MQSLVAGDALKWTLNGAERRTKRNYLKYHLLWNQLKTDEFCN